MDELRKALVEFGRQIREALKPFFETLRRIWERLRPLVRAVRNARARESWRQAQQSARFLSRHPDIAEFDGWLDRWYPDPVASQ